MFYHISLISDVFINIHGHANQIIIVLGSSVLSQLLFGNTFGSLE